MTLIILKLMLIVCTPNHIVLIWTQVEKKKPYWMGLGVCCLLYDHLLLNQLDFC